MSDFTKSIDRALQSSTPAPQEYADNTLYKEADESQIDLTIAYTIEPKPLSEDEHPDAPIRFYCKHCKEFTEVNPKTITQRRKKIRTLNCVTCDKHDQIYIGTERSIRHHLHLPDAA